MTDTRYPARLDFLTQLLDVHWPSSNGLVLITPDIGGINFPQPVTITGLPFGEISNALLGTVKVPVPNTPDTPIATQPSKAMLSNLYAWAPGYVQYNQDPAVLSLGLFPDFSDLGNIILNIGKIKSDFPDWDKTFKINLPALGGTVPTIGARQRYIVYSGPPNSSQTPGTYWWAVYADGLDDYPPELQEYILGNYDGEPELFLNDGTPLPLPQYAQTQGQTIRALGDGSDALATATFITASSHYFGEGTPTISVDSWVIDFPTSGQEAFNEIDVGLFSTTTPVVQGNKTQNFNINFLAGGDEGGWWTNNSPWLIKNSHQQFKTFNFGDLPAITKTVTVQYDNQGNPTGLTMT